MKENVILEKSFEFAVRIVNLYKYLANEKKEYVLSKQMLRCGTSIVANLSESQDAISKKDFLAKVYISLKECRETETWLKLLYRTDYLNQAQYESIISDCLEILRILTSIAKSTKNKIDK